MRKFAAVAFVILGLTFGIPVWAELSFTRSANTTAGRAVYETGPITVKVLDPEDPWQYTSQDILPFDYEQGVTFVPQVAGDLGEDSLIVSSRGALMRTTLGCPDPEDMSQPCYDEKARNSFPISRGEFNQGFNHIGDISAGRAGPAEGFVFAPLEKSPGTKNARGYLAFYVGTLQRAGTKIETVNHAHHSWVTVDPSGNWLLAGDESLRVIRVLQISLSPNPESSSSRVLIAPPERRNLDVIVTPTGGWPNFAGCAFRDLSTIYCANWVDVNDLDVLTEVYRLDLNLPVGIPGATAKSTLAFTLHLDRSHTLAPIPFGMETEGLTLYPRSDTSEMHILLRGEKLDAFYFVHLAPVRRS